MIIAAFGYLTQCFTSIHFPSYEAIISQIVEVPDGISELVLFLWLLVKGVNVEQ
ncbi:MAG: DUF4386 family protein [Candidatus Marinimicrobia bacterium]|nr:DUF4386 family protein [Candidatus Neomarinimicrobiota bacterium]MBL7046856.1 DUF4386 family protein [Candidatus Neomarinimicrobiota bacterium]